MIGNKKVDIILKVMVKSLLLVILTISSMNSEYIYADPLDTCGIDSGKSYYIKKCVNRKVFKLYK